MTKPSHISLADLRGFQRLTNDAVVGLTDLVEAMHHTIGRTPSILGKAPRGRTRGITGLVYKSVRGITRLVGGSVDALLGLLAPLIADRSSTLEREAVVAALNGVLGDHLDSSGNSLAIAMRLRTNGTALAMDRAAMAAAFPQVGRKVVILLHGLCMNDLQWLRAGHDHGAALARDLGYTPLYLHYNTGNHISTTGRAFGEQMEAFIRAWPHPIDRLTIIGHSMGGLVARSGCHYAALAGQSWLKRLDDLVFVGTPHFGAPLARAGAWVDYVVGISPYTAPFARLGKVRSAGIKDLQHGYVVDEDWQLRPASRVGTGGRSLPLPRGVRCYAIAASKQERAGAPGKATRGDGLVPVNSALGRDKFPSRDLRLSKAHRWIGYDMGHLDLLSRQEVYVQIREWLAADRRRVGQSLRPRSKS
jgi:pimeloyl-ACP methyl ester carboxylesterase